MGSEPTALELALAAIEDAWSEVRDGVFVAVSLGQPVARLPQLNESAAIASASRAQAVLERIRQISTDALPADVANTLALARATMHRRAHSGRWWWVVFDPMEIGFWALYAPTAYGGGFLLNQVNRLMASAPLAQPGDIDRYLGLIEDYARVVRQLDERTRGQAERGIHLPRVQLEQAVRLVQGLWDGAAAVLVRGDDKVVRERIRARVTAVVDPAFDAMHAWLADPQRLKDAGNAVGMSELPDGREVYAELVAQHLTCDVAAEEVHDLGHKRLMRIRADMQAIADELGEPDARAVLSRMASDPGWRADSPEGVAAHFERYIARMAVRVDDVFHFQPQAGYGVAPLPESLSAGMTFGFYDKPGGEQPQGRYLFHAENLQRQHLANVAALTFHELVPGHHTHFATQLENACLHPLRKNALLNAFNEGWAEYAATLAGELGLYREPEERFGHLLMDAFLTTRLVVDTGMNAMGWSLGQARDFMRAHAFISEAEILTESVRYSCDIPGQALAYKFGESFLLRQRELMRDALADRFDIRDFHDVVLRPGGLPLTEVSANVSRAIAASAASAAGSSLAPDSGREGVEHQSALPPHLAPGPDHHQQAHAPHGVLDRHGGPEVAE